MTTFDPHIPTELVNFPHALIGNPDHPAGQWYLFFQHDGTNPGRLTAITHKGTTNPNATTDQTHALGVGEPSLH